MSRDDDPSSNVFVRFKHHVDSNIASGFHTMLGLPSPPSRPQGSSSAGPTGPANTTPPNSGPTAGSSCPRHVTDLQAASSVSWDAVLLGLSPYSPRALRHLPPPVPNDLPPHLESSASSFTFEDALEDLLVVSRGQPLPDITARYGQRKLLRQMFPAGEPAWFWLQRLRSQGLVDTPGGSTSYTSLEPDWSRFRQDLERKAADVWRGVAGETGDELSAADFFHELGRTFRRIEEAFSEREPKSELETANQPPPQRQPDHFDDLFTIAESAFAEPQKSWDTFMKVITDHHNQSSLESPLPQTNRPVESARNNSQVVTRDEHVDRFGYLHSKVTVKTLDTDGNEIGSETNYTVRPGDKTSDYTKGMKSSDNEPEAVGKKPGWFWK